MWNIARAGDNSMKMPKYCGKPKSNIGKSTIFGE